MPKRKRRPKTEPHNENINYALIFKNFEDEQLLNLPILIELHGMTEKVRVLVEEGVDIERFARLMMRVRKELPRIKFDVCIEIPNEKMQKIEREHGACLDTDIVI